MTQLPLPEAIDRFKDNEERIDIFVNGDEAASYEPTEGADVPSVRKFLADKDEEINTAAEGILAQTVAQRELAAAWAQSETAPDDEAPESKSAKSWAEVAEGYADLLAEEYLGAYPSRAAVEATSIPLSQQRLFAWHNDLLLAYDRATVGTALTSADGAKWMPATAFPAYLQHWGVTTYSSEAAALAAGAAMTSGERLAQQTALSAAFGEVAGELIIKGFVEAFDQIAINPARVVKLLSGADFHGICVSSRFNMAAACIVQGGTTAGGGCVVESLNILCDQAPAMASGLRADLIQYPSAFDCAGDFGALKFLRVQRAYTAFRAVREDSANNGGWRVGRIEYSSFSEGVKIGTATKGPLHFFAIADLDAWPYGFAGNANLLAIYYDGTGRQAYFGRCDNLTVDRMGIFRGGRIEVEAASGLPVQIDKLALDGDGAELRLLSGTSIIGSIYATEAATAPQLDFKIKCSGGSHRINACDIVGDATPFVEVTGGELTVTGKFYNTNLTVGQIATVTAGELNILDSRLVWPNGARVVPAVEQSGTGVLRMVGCSVDPTITTAGVAVKFNTDRPGNYVEHGAFGIHSVTLPAGALAGVYGRQQRIDLVAKCAAGWRAMPGQIYLADGVAYVGSAGATAISDLPGLLPSGFVSPRHFGANCDGSNETTAISAAWAYYQTIQVDGGSQFAPVTALPFKWNPGLTRAGAGLILTLTGVGATMIGDGEVSQVRNVTIRTENAQNPRIRNFEIRQVLGKAISSIADNGAGKIQVTTTTAHGLTVGEYTRVNGTAAYDGYEARVAVLAVVSTTVVDLDRAYVAPAGAQGVLGGDAIILGPGTNSAHVTDMHMKEIAGVGIAYEGAAGTRTARNHVEKSMYGTALLEYGENNYDEGSVFETCQRFCIDIRTGGEWKTSNTRGGGVGANNVNDAGGWATMRILGRPSTVTDDGPVEHYHTNVSLSGSQSGGLRYDIVSIADNGSGKLRITTSAPHERCVGNGDIVLNGTAAYDAGGAKSNVLAVISPTVFDLDRAYTAPAGAVGQVWSDGWDLLIVTETPLPNVVNDQKFVGGNINKTKIDGGYKIEFIGTRLKEAIYLTDNVYNNRIMIVGDGRGRANSADNGNTLLDIPVYGPGSHRGWSRVLSGIDNPTNPLVNGGERLVLQAPYTPAGVGANSLPSLVENGVNKDGVLWRVNGKEATIKESAGLLKISGASTEFALGEMGLDITTAVGAAKVAQSSAKTRRDQRRKATVDNWRFGATGWEPITGLGAKLAAWWDVDTYASLMVDDGAGLISSWTDRVLGRALTATGSARPTYSATGLYGRPCITFDGVANVLSTTTLTGIPTGSAAGGLVAVTGPWIVAATTHAVAYGSTGTNAARRLSTNTGGLVNSSNNTVAQTGTTANVPLNILIGEWNGTTASLYQNGVTSGDSPEAVALATATSYFRAGASVAATPAQFAAIQVTDIMVISGVLTPYERRKLEGYLAWKRSGGQALRKTHPHYDYAPLAGSRPKSARPYRYVTTNNQRMSGATAAVGANTGFKGRTTELIGGDDCSEIRVGFSNWYIDNQSSSSAETDNADAVTLSKVAMVYEGVSVPVTFDGGSRSVVLAAGETLKLSDIVEASSFGYDRFKAGTVLEVRYMGTLASSSSVMLYNEQGSTEFTTSQREQGFHYPAADAVDDVDSLGNMTTPANNIGSLIIGPTAIIGRFDGAPPVLEVFADSIPHGLRDFISGGISSNGVGGYSGGVNGGGWVRRALQSLGLPYSITSKVGHQYAHMAANYAKRATFFKYSTHALFTLGTNDLNAGISANNIIASATPIWAAYRAAGGQGVYHATIVPRVGSNSYYGTDLEHQAPSGAYVRGGERDRLNQQLRNNAPGLLNAIADISKAVSDPNDPSKWAVPKFSSTLLYASLATDTALSLTSMPQVEMCLVMEPGTANAEAASFNVISVGTVGGDTAAFSSEPFSLPHSAGAVVKATLAGDGTHPSAQAHHLMSLVAMPVLGEIEDVA